jgi:ribosomal protein S18 acetylase RimI-like enzyme
MNQRPFRGPADFAAIMALAIQAPVEQFSATALPYQLSSWATDDPANVGLWADEQGQLLAFALLQAPFASLYYTLHPAVDATAFLPTVLTWGQDRAAALAQKRDAPFTFSVFAAEGHDATAAQIEARGFTHQSPTRLLLWREGVEAPPRTDVPAGFQVRHLRGLEEAAAAAELLNAAFNITTFTTAWRARILAQATYRPELDVVVTTPNGDLAAFCLCWCSPDGRIGQIEPMGTHPAYQRRGLARAALIEGLWRLHDLGVERVYVGTSAANHRSLPLYASVGFRLHHAKRAYQLTVAPGR